MAPKSKVKPSLYKLLFFFPQVPAMASPHKSIVGWVLWFERRPLGGWPHRVEGGAVRLLGRIVRSLSRLTGGGGRVDSPTAGGPRGAAEDGKAA
jgi:hypothetical protein